MTNPTTPLAVAVLAVGAAEITYKLAATKEARDYIKGLFEVPSFRQPSAPDVHVTPSLPSLPPEPEPEPLPAAPSTAPTWDFMDPWFIALTIDTGLTTNLFKPERRTALITQAEAQMQNFTEALDDPRTSEEAKIQLRRGIDGLNVILGNGGTYTPDYTRIDSRTFLPYNEPPAPAPSANVPAQATDEGTTPQARETIRDVLPELKDKAKSDWALIRDAFLNGDIHVHRGLPYSTRSAASQAIGRVGFEVVKNIILSVPRTLIEAGYGATEAIIGAIESKLPESERTPPGSVRRDVEAANRENWNQLRGVNNPGLTAGASLMARFLHWVQGD